MFVCGPLPQPALVRRREVGLAENRLAGRVLDHRLRNGEVDLGNALGYAGKAELKLVDRRTPARSRMACTMPSSTSWSTCMTSLVTDEAEFGVEPHVLREMARGVSCGSAR